jgi:hypothetical protein
LLSLTSLDDSNEISPPPFSALCIEVIREGNNNDSKKLTKLAIRCENQASIINFNGLSDPSFVAYLTDNNPDIIVFYGDQNLLSPPDAPFFKNGPDRK